MDPWTDALAADGYRLTEARRAVIDVLRRSEAPLQPQEILALARVLHAALGLATVYRTVRLLTDAGLLRRIHRPDGCHGYLPASSERSDLVLCRVCGRAEEFRGAEAVRALVRQVEVETGYTVTAYLLQCSGLCAACADLRPTMETSPG